MKKSSVFILGFLFVLSMIVVTVATYAWFNYQIIKIELESFNLSQVAIAVIFLIISITGTLSFGVLVVVASTLVHYQSVGDGLFDISPGYYSIVSCVFDRQGNRALMLLSKLGRKTKKHGAPKFYSLPVRLILSSLPQAATLNPHDLEGKILDVEVDQEYVFSKIIESPPAETETE
ncbi:MAG: hypothetical protein Q7K65_05080 [Candidatus Buchananbacteria bacterium]|nr:hypothetical protein [Candidatus Buchananbacteria bacterium]